MLKMTIILLDSLFNIRVFFILNMEKIIQLPKRTAPNSLALKLNDQARWNQCDSFSSCSDDSTAYCSNFNGNHLSTIHQSQRLIKRSRHSSGSSGSSNLSCVSDKESNKLSITLSSPSMMNCPGNTPVRSSDLNRSDVNSRSLDFNHKTIIKNAVPCSNISESISPYRHNLRRNIRKKKCSCDCSSSCETLIVRRYNELDNTSMNSKALISSAKVKTFMPNSSSVIEATSKSDSSRKRRSEVEKLYESLHEIEWAKNFSPDNILTQFNIRQAASCSVFGRSPNHSLGNKNKKQKVLGRQISKSLSPTDSLGYSEVYDCNENFSYSSNEVNLDKCKNDQSSFRLQANFHQYGKTENSCNLKSGEKFLSRKFSCVQEMNSDVPNAINSSAINEKQSSSVITVSDDDAHSSNSDESSIISVSTTDLPLTNFDNFQCHSNGELNDSVNDSDYSLIPSFFDFAEEGIRTVGACFDVVREVGAEVVVSTCYEDTQSLPILSSVKDSESCTSSSNDVPPVLEACVNISDSKVQSQQHHSPTTESSIIKNKTDKSIKSLLTNQIKNLLFCKKNIKSRLFSKRKHFFAIRLGKRIVKKYVKYLFNRQKLKKLSTFLQTNYQKKIEVKDSRVSNKRTSNPVKNNKPSNEKNNSIPAAAPITIKKSEYKYQKIDNEEIVQSEKSKISIFSSTGLRVDYVNDTTVVGTKDSVFANAIQKVTNSVSVAQTIQHRSNSSPHFVTKIESTQKSIETETQKCLQILQPKESYEFGNSTYKSLQVNAARNYVQVILQVTRSNAIFLTLEALLELTDVIRKVSANRTCQVLIIHGSADCFCLGLDLKPLLGSEKNKISTQLAIGVKDLIEALANLRKPMVAVINGPAMGLGVTLLNHADVKIASKHATFSMPYYRLGYSPEGGATVSMCKVVGPSVAMELLLGGRILTALEAKCVGLITDVFEDKYLPHELVSSVKTLNNNSFSALEVTKGMIQIPLMGTLQNTLNIEVKILPRMWLTESCQVAMKSAFKSGFLPYK